MILTYYIETVLHGARRVSDDSKFIEIIAKLGDISERTARIEEKCNHMEDDISNIKIQDIRQNELLDKHILGVQTNTQRLELEIQQRKELELNLRIKHKEASIRLAELESFPKFKEQLFKYVKSIALWLSAVGGAVMLLDKFFNFI